MTGPMVFGLIVVLLAAGVAGCVWMSLTADEEAPPEDDTVSQVSILDCCCAACCHRRRMEIADFRVWYAMDAS